MVPDDSFFETLGLLDEADPLESCSNSKLEHSTQPLDGDQDTTLSSSFKMWFYVIWDDPGLDRAEFATQIQKIKDLPAVFPSISFIRRGCGTL